MSNNRTSIHHKANSSILSETHSRKYKRFVRKINMDAKNKYSKTRSHTDGFQRNNAKCLDEKGISRFVPHSSI